MISLYNKSGFTLVEMSIVLVIIGLIVGGVIAGKSLIETAKLQNLIQEINDIRLALNTYELKYDALPGDHINAQAIFGAAACPNGGGGTNPCNGDGSNTIEDGVGYEDTRQFQHMALASIFHRKLKTWTSNGGGALHISSFGQNAGGTIHYSPDLGQHVIRFADDSSTYGSYYSKSVIPSKDAMRIDKKYDDGQANSGKITASLTGTHHRNWTDAELCHTNSGDYRLDNIGPICILYFSAR